MLTDNASFAISGGPGRSLSIHRPTLCEGAPAEEARRTRAVPTVRYAGLQLSRVLHQHEGSDRSVGVEHAKVETLKHTTLATARLRFLFLAAKIWRHAGRVGVSYSDHYEEKGIFCRLLDRLRAIAPKDQRFAPVLATPLTG